MDGTSDVTRSATSPWLEAVPDVRLDLLFIAVLVGSALYVLQAVFHVHPDQDVMPPIGMLLASQPSSRSRPSWRTALTVAITRDGPTSFGWETGSRLRDLATGVASGVAVMGLEA